MKATEVKKFKKSIQNEMGYTKWKKEIKHDLADKYKLEALQNKKKQLEIQILYEESGARLDLTKWISSIIPIVCAIVSTATIIISPFVQLYSKVVDATEQNFSGEEMKDMLEPAINYMFDIFGTCSMLLVFMVIMLTVCIGINYFFEEKREWKILCFKEIISIIDEILNSKIL